MRGDENVMLSQWRCYVEAPSPFRETRRRPCRRSRAGRSRHNFRFSFQMTWVRARLAENSKQPGGEAGISGIDAPASGRSSARRISRVPWEYGSPPARGRHRGRCAIRIQISNSHISGTSKRHRPCCYDGAGAPEVLVSSALEMRARGTPDARAHPQPRVQRWKAHECRHHGCAETSGVPHAMVGTAYSALSPVDGSFATVLDRE